MNAPGATGRLILRTSGAFGATDQTGTDIAGLSRRGQALLAYLSQQQGMCAERGSLADLLWGDRGEEQARASLRQELSILRKSLPVELMQADRQKVWLDATRVETEAPGEDEFLKGFDLPGESFEDWLRAMRLANNPSDAGQSTLSTSQFFARPSVLLFAFDTLSTGRNDQMIAMGLADDLRTTLSYWRWFPVIGPEAIGWISAKDADLRSVARQVQAAYAVTGSVRCLDERVSISVGLTEIDTGRSLWSNRFDGVLDDIFKFQEDVSRAIVAQIEPQISHAEATRISRLRPDSIGPWQAMAQADDIDRKGGEGYGSPESNLQQARLMEKTLAQDPEFAPALARLGRINFRAGLLGWWGDRSETFGASIDFSRRALDLDPYNWEAHAYLGLTHIFELLDYHAGEFHGSEAVRLNPSSALARHGYGCGLEWIGRPQEALEHLNLIFRLNPNHGGRAAALGDITTCEMFVGNRERALDAAHKLLPIARDYSRGLQRCVATFGYFDEISAAQKALDRLVQIQPDFDAEYVRATYPYARPENFDTLMQGFVKARAFER